MKKQKILLNALSIIMGGICGFVGMIGIEKVVPYDKFGMPTIIIGMFAIFVIFYILILLHTFIHETGHMVFGLLTGYKFSSIRFLSFMFLKTKGGEIKLKRYKVAGTAGQCLMLPPENDNGTYPYLLYNMGGCIFNLIIGIVAVILWSLTDGAASIVWMFAGIIGIFTALINGIPIKPVSNDGYNTLVFSKNKTAIKIFWTQLKIIESQSRGIAILDMPVEWFEYLGQINEFDNLINISGYSTLINYYVEKRNFEKVKEMCIYLSENAKEILPIHEAIIKAENLFAYLVTDRDNDKINELTGKECMTLYKLLASQVSMYRIWYAYYKLYDKDSKKSQNYLDKMNKAEKTYPFPADFASEKELISYVDNIACNGIEAE